MNRFRQKLKRNQVWSFGIFVSDESFGFDRHLEKPRFVLDSRHARIRRDHVHTAADPFLFVDRDELYVFYEKQSVCDHGVIEALKTKDLVTFEPLGEILREPFHVSYPCVFRSGSDTFLVPESRAAGEICLYKFADFPRDPVKQRTLVTGSYQDPSITFQGGYWYLFATKKDRLELFVSNDLESGEFVLHPASPLSTDLTISQCGGGVVELNSLLYRVAQDRSIEYGRNVNILKILELSPTDYREQIFNRDYLKQDHSWNAHGGHHLSIVDFLGKKVIAVDGKQKDLGINPLLAVGWAAFRKAARLLRSARQRIRRGDLAAPPKARPKFSREIS